MLLVLSGLFVLSGLSGLFEVVGLRAVLLRGGAGGAMSTSALHWALLLAAAPALWIVVGGGVLVIW